ncbi:MAG: GNAT family N-acetyltransferase [Chloroflexota bacterium]
MSDEQPAIAALTTEDIRELRLPWLSRFNVDSLTAHLHANPGLSFWVPRTGEYIIAEMWRRRDDIGNIVEVTARKGRAALVRTLLDTLRATGNRLVLMPDEVWSDRARLYGEMGFGPVEKIVFFHKDLKSTGALETAGPLPQLDYSLATPHDLETLLNVDHNSFPWLWWNSPEDMANYLRMDGVSAYLARKDDKPVGYASFTMYNGWAHLDRLAVVESAQGRKYGAAQLSHVMGIMVSHGADYVGLSTQENNFQSHRLYNGFGFKQTRDSMKIYGLSLREP